MNKKHSKVIRLAAAMICCFVLLASFTAVTAGAANENNTVNFSVYNSTDSASLYLTGVVKGYFSKIYTYIYFADGITDSVEKLQKDKIQRACVIAYMTPDEYKTALRNESEKYRIVLVDNYNSADEVNGMWVARADWIEQCPTAYKNTVRGLLRSMNYRAKNMNMTLDEAKLSVKNKKTDEYDFENSETDVMQFIAVYQKDNSKDSAMIAESSFNAVSGDAMQLRYMDFDVGAGDGYNEAKSLYKRIFDKDATDEELKAVFDFVGLKNADLVEKVEVVEEKEMKPIIVILAAVLLAAAAAVAVYALIHTLKKLIAEARSYRKT